MEENTKMFKRTSLLSLLLVVLLLSVTVTLAQEGGGLTAVPDAVTPDSAYTVDTEDKSAPASESAMPTAQRAVAADDLRVASIIVTFDESVNAEEVAAVSGGEVIYRFSKVFNGASLVVAGDQVDNIAAMTGVTGIYLDELLQPDTEASPGFIGAPVLWHDLGGQQSAGEGVIVGILDSGVWPEHPSFSDPDPFGNAFPAPPTIPGSNGFGAGGPRSTCDFGNTAWNSNDALFTCNHKLIGAYDFTDTYKAVVGLLPGEFDSARDADGHGTHTATTAAGNGGVEASIYGVPRGTVSGIAPRAHVIMYKVCNDQGCYSSDSAAAVEQAILDNVDAINFSISGGNNPYSDVVSLAFLAAYENGVFVAASAGNSGPGADTVAHREPWTTTVAASTSDRHFISTLTLEADNGDSLTLEGVTLTDGISTPTPVIFPPAGQELCLNPFPAGTFSGEIVICQRGVNARVAKSYNVAVGGAAGMLLYNPALQGLSTDNHFIPTVHLENDAGADLLAFMAAHTGETATFTPGVATAVQGDVMAAFSSRGGPGQSLGISKPDITAPGVQILAGHTPLPLSIDGGLPGQLFQAIQGTSMSSPHIAGSAALLKDLHPDWTPGQIKSALMMTANANHFKEDGVTPADPFDMGSGRVDLSEAGDAGLTISATGQEYVDLEGELWNANYPSLYVPVMPGRVTVERTVHNESSRLKVWHVRVNSPDDVDIYVRRTLVVRGNDDKTFHITVDASQVPLGEVRHAELLFTRHGEALRFPITIVRNEPVVTLEKSCDPTVFPKQSTTDCTITIENTSFDDTQVHVTDLLPRHLKLERGTLVGGNERFHRLITFDGLLAGAAPPNVNVAVDPSASPAGYLPLSAFGIAPVAGVGDESIVNFNVPSFTFAGESWSRIGIVSNGYLVVGGGTSADVEYLNTNLPDATPPNNMLAPFWTDLNPSAGGALRVGVLTDGVDRWIIIDWENVPNYGDSMPNDFQVWIGVNTDTNPGEDISFVYGPDISAGDGGFLTVGAENKFGNSGATTYFNGVGSPPASIGYEVDVFSSPGAPGETHVISYTARGLNRGEWTNCAEMTGDIFFGTNIACISGEITK